MKKLLFLVVTLFPSCFLTLAFADREEVAELYSLEGSAEVRPAGGDAWRPLQQGAQLSWGDSVRVSEFGRAGIQFRTGGFVRLGGSAQLTLQQPGSTSAPPVVQFDFGQGYFFNRQDGDRPLIKTPTVSAAMRGTELLLAVTPEQTIVQVLEGNAEAYNDRGSVLLAVGDEAVAARGSAPLKRSIISVDGAVQWTLSVPPVIDFRSLAAERSPAPEVGRALALLNQGHFDAGTELLSQLPPYQELAAALLTWKNSGPRAALLKLRSAPLSNQQATLLRSTLLLASGQLPLARATLNAASPLPAGLPASDARAQQALITLTESPTAAELTQIRAELLAALHAEPDSISLRTVLSLVYQAEGDLEAAAKVLGSTADSPYVALRAATLAMGRGAYDQAYALVREIKVDEPSLQGEVATLHGFIELARGEREAATAAFTEGRAYLPGNAEPLFGLGLVAMQRDDKAAARSYFEAAAALEPRTSTFRSYLGKLFYEEGDYARAHTEFDIAEQLDEHDPTPHLYRSFVLRAQNRPIEALQAVERSIARNDRRTILRAGTLLDDDAAIRSTNLGETFRTLGFEEVARVTAARALAKNYLDPAAHRLFGSSADTIFEADTAFSERRISRLLAPLSIAELDALAVTTSLSDFSPAFERDETRGTVAVNLHSLSDTVAAEGLLVTRSESFGAGLSASYDMQDGSKGGSFTRRARSSAALSWSPRWNHLITLDGTMQGIDQEEISAEEETFEVDSVGSTLGYRGTLSPYLTVLAQGSLEKSDEDAFGSAVQEEILSTQIFEGGADTLSNLVVGNRSRSGDLTGRRGELQFVWQSELLTSILHLDYFKQSADRDDELLILNDELGEFFNLGVLLRSADNLEVSSSTVSWYNTLHLTSWADITLGIARERVERSLQEIPPYINASEERSRTSPRFGVVLTPHEELTIRGSYREGLRKAALEDQASIEPTNLAGFAQAFNDLPATESRAAALGVDWHPVRSTYLGGSLTRRWLNEPLSSISREFIVNFDTESVSDQLVDNGSFDNHIDQRFGTAYLYHLFSEQLVGSLDYRYSLQKLLDPGLAEDLEEHDLALALRYFLRNGLFLFGRTRYRDQKIEAPEEATMSDDALLFDLGIGIRLPNRRGVITLTAFNIGDEKLDLRQGDGFQQPLASGVNVLLSVGLNF